MATNTRTNGGRSLSVIKREFDEEALLERAAIQLVSVQMAEGILKLAEERAENITAHKVELARTMLTITKAKPRLELNECSNAVLKALDSDQRDVKSVTFKRSSRDPDPQFDNNTTRRKEADNDNDRPNGDKAFDSLDASCPITTSKKKSCSCHVL